jgi:hypothetical protein
MSKKIKKTGENAGEEKDFPGYPHYPEKEDIFSQEKKELIANEEDLEKIQQKKKGTSAGNDLDVPGAELDDEDEAIGEEDEENNYYSLGGDNHEDLEEDKGD